ncbi:Zinc finger protein 844 [Lemmus lemmus]
MSAVSVGGASVIVLTFVCTREFTLGKSPSNVKSVGKPLGTPPASACIKESTLERSPINVMSVASASTRECTQERSPIGVVGVGRPSVRVLASASTRGCTQGRNLLSVMSVARPSARVQAFASTREYTPRRETISRYQLYKAVLLRIKNFKPISATRKETPNPPTLTLGTSTVVPRKTFFLRKFR